MGVLGYPDSLFKEYPQKLFCPQKRICSVTKIQSPIHMVKWNKLPLSEVRTVSLSEPQLSVHMCGNQTEYQCRFFTNIVLFLPSFCLRVRGKGKEDLLVLSLVHTLE